MAKQSSPNRLQVRDIVTGLLFVGLIGTNYYWYEMYKGVDISLQNGATGWLTSQAQISKLQNCINQGIKPCDISPTQP